MALLSSFDASASKASRGFRRVRQARDHSRGRALQYSVRPIPKDEINSDHHGTDPSLGVVVLSAAFPQGQRSGVCRHFLPGRRRPFFFSSGSNAGVARRKRDRGAIGAPSRRGEAIREDAFPAGRRPRHTHCHLSSDSAAAVVADIAAVRAALGLDASKGGDA